MLELLLGSRGLLLGSVSKSIESKLAAVAHWGLALLIVVSWRSLFGIGVGVVVVVVAVSRDHGFGEDRRQRLLGPHNGLCAEISGLWTVEFLRSVLSSCRAHQVGHIEHERERTLVLLLVFSASEELLKNLRRRQLASAPVCVFGLDNGLNGDSGWRSGNSVLSMFSSMLAESLGRGDDLLSGGQGGP